MGSRTPAAIVGAGSAGVQLLEELQHNPQSRYAVQCFFDDDPAKVGNRIHGVPVKGKISDVERILQAMDIHEVILAIPSVHEERRHEILQALSNLSGSGFLVLPSNGFGMPDLNAVTIDTSPAYTFGMEHLSGRQYAHYLKLVAQAYQLPIIEHTTAKDILTVDDGYQVITNQGTITTKYLIMAVGQYHTPRLTPHPENVVHYSQVDSWESFSGHDQIIVGANESGIDAAINLAQLGDKVTVITDETGLDADEADPEHSLGTSYSASVYEFIT